MDYLRIFWMAIGSILLIFGRKVYWLSLGAVGFLLGYYLASRFLSITQVWVNLLIALAVGLTCAFLIYYLQRFAIALAGLLAGGYLVILVLDLMNTQSHELFWIWVVLGAIIGAILASILFDWTLILLSSLAGSLVIVQNLPIALQPMLIAVLFIFLLAMGLIIQSRLMRRR